MHEVGFLFDRLELHFAGSAVQVCSGSNGRCGEQWLCKYVRKRFRFLDVFAGTSHAACTQTRRITASSITLALVGFSTGESELHGIVKPRQGISAKKKEQMPVQGFVWLGEGDLDV